jgi:hypothetical protein
VAPLEVDTKILVGKGVPGEVSPKEKAKRVEAGKRQQLALGEVGIEKRAEAPAFSDFVKRFQKSHPEELEAR